MKKSTLSTLSISLLAALLLTGCLPFSNRSSTTPSSSASAQSIVSEGTDAFAPRYPEYTLVGPLHYAPPTSPNRIDLLQGELVAFSGIVKNAELLGETWSTNYGLYLNLLPGANSDGKIWRVKVNTGRYADLDKLQQLFPIGSLVDVYGVYNIGIIKDYRYCSIDIKPDNQANHQIIHVDSGLAYRWGDFLQEGTSFQLVPPPANEVRPTLFKLEEYSLHRYWQEQMEGYYVSHFSEGLARVSNCEIAGMGEQGYINTKGEWVIPCELKSIHLEAAPDYHFDFHEGMAAFYSEEKGGLGFINTKGEVVIPPLPGTITCGIFQNGLAPVSIPDAYEMRYITKTGQLVSQWKAPPYASTLEYGDASEGLHIIVDENEQYGYMTPACKDVISPQYKEARPFSEGLAAVCLNNGLWGYINKQGEMVIEPQFLTAGLFHNGRADVQMPKPEDGSPPYDDVYTFYRPFYYIDHTGRQITEEVFDIPVYWDAGSYSITNGTHFHNGYVPQYQENQIVEVINTQGKPANFLTDCLDIQLEDFEKRYVGEWTFNDNAGTLMLFENRTAKLYNIDGKLLYTGNWVGIASGNDDFVIRLDDKNTLVAGDIPYWAIPGESTKSLLTLY